MAVIAGTEIVAVRIEMAENIQPICQWQTIPNAPLTSRPQARRPRAGCDPMESHRAR